MRFVIADSFTNGLKRLDNQAQGLVKQAAFDFQINPAHPSLKFHKLDRARDKNFWSFRVTDDLRIIVHRTADTFTLCYADRHDPAYAWAERRRLDVHPQTGAAQFVEIEEVVQQVVKQVETEPPLFAQYKSDYLSALGVPAEWLDAVRHVGETGFEELIDHLPQEAAERLMDLACGHPVPRPVILTAGDPFTHPDAQRRFRILDDQDELRHALDAPWEKWLVFLHPTQRAMVERDFNGPARVSGSAGTGKSVVALHRAAHLLRQTPAARVLLTTFSRTLASRLAHHADLLLGAESSARQRLAIVHLHRLAHEIWSEHTAQSFRVLSSGRLMGLLQEADQAVGQGAFALPFLRAEWEAIVDPHDVRDWETYKQTSRAGRGVPLGARQRLALWKVFEHVRQALRSNGLLTWNGLCHEAAVILDQGTTKPYDHVVADECQDFGPAELRFLRALVQLGQNDLFLCGDVGQRIYKSPCSWIATGIDVRGRAARLRVNYRTTEQIRRFADQMLPDGVDLGDSEGEPRDTISLLSGPSPHIEGFTDVDAETTGVTTWLQKMFEAGYLPEDIAIFARTESVLKDRAEAVLRACEIPWQHLSDEEPPSEQAVSLGSMHRAKGLEFRIVVVMGVDSALIPLAFARKEIVDQADREAFTEQERHLLYVACTRAREQLLITYTGRPSRFLELFSR